MTGIYQQRQGFAEPESHVQFLHPPAPGDGYTLSETSYLGFAIPEHGINREVATGSLDLALPTVWLGQPRPIEPTDDGGADDVRVLNGVGVSPGVVEGTVRVVTDPTFEGVETGEILVTPTTDPSWASIMFVSSALIVDIGGALSHAAVVARELGIPCVVNTLRGSQTLQTGDLVRVDGRSARVEILQRAQDVQTAGA